MVTKSISLGFLYTVDPFSFIKHIIFSLANVDHFSSFPDAVHACFYSSSSVAVDFETLAPFAKCQQINGGQNCVSDIPAAMECLYEALINLKITTFVFNQYNFCFFK